jgi:Xaa-Pro aminopeptidase
MLDEVAWTLNLRGSDIDYNPVFVSYLLITADSATLYINPAKVNAEVAEYLKAEGVGIQPYADIESALRTLRCAVLAQPDKTNYAAYSCIANPVAKDCPVSTMKIMKNEAEIRGYHSAMLKDGLAMVKWMKWLLPAVEAGG